MKGRHQPLTWNLERFEALKAATDEAVRLSQSAFTVDLDRKHKGVMFGTLEAMGVIQEHAAAIYQPQRRYPENKEGAEP